MENGTKIPDAHAVAAYVAANAATGFSAYPIWTWLATVANGKFVGWCAVAELHDPRPVRL